MRSALLSKAKRSERSTKIVRFEVNDVQVNFQAVASLRKWPSIRGKRHAEAKYPNPYTLLEDTLGECLRELMSKPPTQRHLYQIHTAHQDPIVSEILSAERAAELARLQSFLETLK